MNSIPEWVRLKKSGRPQKYPFARIAVGETFEVPRGPLQPKFSSFRNLVYLTNRKTGKKFLAHQYPDGTIQVYRAS